MFACATITEGAPSLRSLQEPALSGVEGVGRDAADTTFVSSVMVTKVKKLGICSEPGHQQYNAWQPSHEVPLGGICHGSERSRPPALSTRSQPLSLRPPRSRKRSEVAESSRRRALCRSGFADPLPRSAALSPRLSSRPSRGSRHRAHSE